MITTRSIYSNPLFVLIAAAFLVTISMGIRQTMGLFAIPFSELGGGDRAWFGLTIAVQNLLWGCAAPFFGVMADRWGAHITAAVGSILYVLGLLIISQLDSWNLISGQFFIGIGMGACGMAISLSAVAKVTNPSKRSVYLGIVSAAGSFGQFAFIPLAHDLYATLGWAHSFIVLSFIAALMIPLAFGLYGAHYATQRTQVKSADISIQAVLQAALSHRGYILLSSGFFVCGFQVVFIATHLTAYLRDFGVSASAASWALAMIGLFNIFGTLACGYIGGRYSKSLALAWLYALRSIIIVLFLLLPLSDISAIIFGIFIGFLWLGTIPLTSGLVADFFGPRYMTTLYGIVFFSHQIGSFLGAWLGGIAYNYNGSYTAVWVLTIAFGFIASVLHYLIPEQNESHNDTIKS